MPASGTKECNATSASVFSLEARRILGLPPVAQNTVAVGLASLVVKAVADFVADDGADGAVVDRVVGIGIEERRLQNRRGNTISFIDGL